MNDSYIEATKAILGLDYELKQGQVSGLVKSALEAESPEVFGKDLYKKLIGDDQESENFRKAMATLLKTNFINKETIINLCKSNRSRGFMFFSRDPEPQKTFEGIASIEKYGFDLQVLMPHQEEINKLQVYYAVRLKGRAQYNSFAGMLLEYLDPQGYNNNENASTEGFDMDFMTTDNIDSSPSKDILDMLKDSSNYPENYYKVPKEAFMSIYRNHKDRNDNSIDEMKISICPMYEYMALDFLQGSLAIMSAMDQMADILIPDISLIVFDYSASLLNDSRIGFQLYKALIAGKDIKSYIKELNKFNSTMIEGLNRAA